MTEIRQAQSVSMGVLLTEQEARQTDREAGAIMAGARRWQNLAMMPE
jgi:hypothetical protein